MTTVAVMTVGVIAHEGKSLGGGLDELEAILAERSDLDVKWYRIAKSKAAPDAARKALHDGVELVLVWGGDGTAQRCLDVFAGSSVSVGLLPAGTANLLAGNLKVPIDLAGALEVAFSGARRRIDVGVLNGERFAIMGGAGLDAVIMQRSDGAMKERFGRATYVWAGVRATRSRRPRTTVKVDGKKWFKGRASCVLLGNMGRLPGGIEAFPNARCDDGILEVGVVTAKSPTQWVRVLASIACGKPSRSKFVRMTRGRSMDVTFDRPTTYELDGGARKKTRYLEVSVEPGAVVMCVPGESLS